MKGKLMQVENLYAEVRATLEQARASAYRAVNFAMVQAYGRIGRLIVEHEQDGADRAEYGRGVLEELSRRLTAEFGKGFTPANLRNMRQFFLMFGKRYALRDELPESEKRDAARLESTEDLPGLRSELTWTHYRLLLRVEDEHARKWYMHTDVPGCRR